MCMSDELPSTGTSSSASLRKTPEPAVWRRVLYVVVRVLIPVAVLGVALWVAWGWLYEPPSAERREREAVARLVEVATVHVKPERVVVTAMGTVRPAQRVALKPHGVGPGDVGGTTGSNLGRCTRRVRRWCGSRSATSRSRWRGAATPWRRRGAT